MSNQQTTTPVLGAADLIARLADLSGQFRFYAVDFERISRQTAQLASDIAGQLDAGKAPTSEQLADAEEFTEFFAEGAVPEYDFAGAEKAGSQIWLIVKVLSGEWVLHNGEYVTVEEIEKGTT
jgi:hypothetical protein